MIPRSCHYKSFLCRFPSDILKEDRLFVSTRFFTCIFPTSFSKNTVVDDIYIPRLNLPCRKSNLTYQLSRCLIASQDNIRFNRALSVSMEERSESKKLWQDGNPSSLWPHKSSIDVLKSLRRNVWL